MIILTEAPRVSFDVDDTLIMWSDKLTHLETVEVTCEGTTHTYFIHSEHVEQLKKHARRGHTVEVWSKGGSIWAQAVVKALKLESYVNLVGPKPFWYYDDLDAQDWMGERNYLESVKYLGEPYDS